jgi:hypothetical protein
MVGSRWNSVPHLYSGRVGTGWTCIIPRQSNKFLLICPFPGASYSHDRVVPTHVGSAQVVCIRPAHFSLYARRGIRRTAEQIFVIESNGGESPAQEEKY